jgi:hypothetical protein
LADLVAVTNSDRRYQKTPDIMLLWLVAEDGKVGGSYEQEQKVATLNVTTRYS